MEDEKSTFLHFRIKMSQWLMFLFGIFIFFFISTFIIFLASDLKSFTFSRYVKSDIFVICPLFLVLSLIYSLVIGLSFYTEMYFDQNKIIFKKIGRKEKVYEIKVLSSIEKTVKDDFYQFIVNSNTKINVIIRLSEKELKEIIEYINSKLGDRKIEVKLRGLFWKQDK